MSPQNESFRVREESDIYLVRQVVRNRAAELGFGVLDMTKIVTAASELSRNTLIHGKGGTVLLEALVEPDRRGLRLTFEDNGPGIPDLNQAMTDGFTTNRGLGLGLSGSKRLVSEFVIASAVGAGTQVTVTQWT
jgi:serine/threonine-protein kinase RsbT